ncbi:MAG: ribose 5-phosphate isomerase B [Candidatus Marinimicrobia bacterium]|nr:ribose 5-phosphate isomerase B [Candidatus Neomarinimicrobiota bacterium]
MVKKLFIASDHGGVELKASLVEFAREQGIEIQDLGPFSRDSVDYPDYAAKVARAVVDNEGTMGIAICRSGIGISISANKIKGARAALVCSLAMAELSRRHNDANIICFGADFTDIEFAKQAVLKFISTEFEGGRHAVRVEKMRKLEA